MVLSRSVKRTHSGAMRRPMPTRRAVWRRTPSGKRRMPHPTVAPENTANAASTGVARRNSMPLLRMIRFTQIDRGMDVDLTSRASFVNARVKSVTVELNHTHGRRADRRKTMYGVAPTVRSNTWVKTNQ
ncbi:hypothetical protein QE428_000285 [Microbacterium sp. SORGH_AS 505]|nr:hypothetical protein [Microbacterium sp. SORGH_AS_0505]